MSRAAGLARVLRLLKEELSEVLERKSIYDHDTNRVVVALARFNEIVKREESQREGSSGPSSPPPPKPPPPPTDSEIEKQVEEASPESVPHPPWAKRAYRAIALRTHPDKVNADTSVSDVQRDRLVGLYKEATEAYQSRNYPAIAEIAAELDIDVDIPLEEHERALESKVASIRGEIASVQRTVSWTWGTSYGDTPRRVAVLRRCCAIMGVNTPEESVLVEIVRELEAQPDFDITDRLGRVKRIKAGVERRRPGERPMKRIR